MLAIFRAGAERSSRNAAGSGRAESGCSAAAGVPGSMLITGVEFTDDLVYQTPKGDLIIMVAKKLKKMGASDVEVSNFTHNAAIPLSLQVTAVHNLEALGHIPGRRAVIDALGSVMTVREGSQQ
jgi:hypothetical protein